MSVVSRNTAFSVLKALAIILVVMGHSAAPHYVNAFAYMLHVPIFFISAGYFFSPQSLNDGKTYFQRRIKGIYLPFLRWSIAFLILHNLWFTIGVLNTTVGNGAGVLQPYDAHAFSQRLWSIIFNMSGYDEYLAGAFWFFRAFFLASIAYWVFQKLLLRFSYFSNRTRINTTILLATWGATLWFVIENLRIPGVAQGGYRELMGLFFIAAGGLYREYEERLLASWKHQFFYALLLVCATLYWHSSMKPSATLQDFLALPLPALIGFLFLVNMAKWIDRKENLFRQSLVYIGDRTLYVFAFHFLAFKLVSMLRIVFENRSWDDLGAHPVITPSTGVDLYFILYTIIGIVVPLLVSGVWNKATANLRLPYDRVVTMVMLVFAFLIEKLLYVVRNSKRWAKILLHQIKQIGRLLKDAFNPEQE